MTIVDSRGKSLLLKSAPQRIISLTPSNTELLYALDAGNLLVGVTSADDYPPEVKKVKPISNLTGQVDVELVQALKPDLVVAVTGLNTTTIEQLERAHVSVMTIDAHTINDTYAAVELLGKAMGRTRQAVDLNKKMKADIEAVRIAARGVKSRPKVLMMYGDNPIYTTGPGSFIDDLITLAGGQNIITKSLPQDIISSEQVIVRQPDVLICSKDLKDKAKLLPGWAAGVPAVKNDRIYVPSDEGMLVRPGPRLVTGARELFHFLHPELKL